MPGKAIQHAGSVNFAPAYGARGTDVHVHLQYSAPGGKATSWLAWLAGQDPGQLTRDGLLALKERLEGTAPGPVDGYQSPAPLPVH